MQEEKLKQLIDQWVTQDSRDQGLVSDTISNRKETMYRVFTFLRGEEFNRETMTNYFRVCEQTCVPQSIASYKKVISAFANYLVDLELLPLNFIKKIRTPKVRRIPEKLISAEDALKCIIEGFKPTENDDKSHRERKRVMQLAATFSLFTALRGKELRTLQSREFSWIEGQEEYLVHSKGGSLDKLPMPENLVEVIKKQANDEFVFPKLNMKRMNEGLKRGGAIVGIDPEVKMDVHILRKIFCTEMSKYVTMPKLQALMRHKSITTTMDIYTLYGLKELRQDLNDGHPLIRFSLKPQRVVQNFMNSTVLPYFKNDNRFNVSYTVGENGKLTFEATPL